MQSCGEKTFQQRTCDKKKDNEDFRNSTACWSSDNDCNDHGVL